MIKFFFFIFFFIILLGFLAGFSIIRGIRDVLFGPPPGGRNTKQHTSTHKRTRRPQNSSHKKIIKKDEGEYIDYEEMK